MEDLIKEAQKRYPIGTEFTPAHIKKIKATSIVVTKSFEKKGSCMTALLPNRATWDHTKNPKYGSGHLKYRVVYEDGKWAEITKSVEKKELPIYN